MNIEDLNRTVNIQVNNQPVEVSLEFSISDDSELEHDPAFQPEPGYFTAGIGVQAHAYGLTGFGFIGGCHVPFNNMFCSKFETEVNLIIEDYELVTEAIDHLKEQLQSQYDTLVKKADTFKVFKSEAS